MYRHAHIFVEHICVFFLSCFLNMRPCHAHSILLFYQPQQVQLVLSRGLSPLYLLYLFLFLLAPVGVWTDPISLDQWILPCESQTLGDTGYDKGSWDPCDHHALGQEVRHSLCKLFKNKTKTLFSFLETYLGFLGLLQQVGTSLMA